MQHGILKFRDKDFDCKRYFLYKLDFSQNSPRERATSVDVQWGTAYMHLETEYFNC